MCSGEYTFIYQIFGTSVSSMVTSITGADPSSPKTPKSAQDDSQALNLRGMRIGPVGDWWNQ